MSLFLTVSAAAGPHVSDIGKVGNISAKDTIRKKTGVDNRIMTDSDFRIKELIAEHRDDGRISLDVFVENLGTEWGYSGSSIPVYIYSGKKVGEGGVVSYGMAFSTITSISFPEDRVIRLKLKVDPRNVVAETNESNNTCSIELKAGETVVTKVCP